MTLLGCHVFSIIVRGCALTVLVVLLSVLLPRLTRWIKGYFLLLIFLVKCSRCIIHHFVVNGLSSYDAAHDRPLLRLKAIIRRSMTVDFVIIHILWTNPVSCTSS